MNEAITKRIESLSERCVENHTGDDIWEHLEEELAELLLAVKRVRRGKEPFINLLEEVVDVHIETITVLTLIKDNIMDQNYIDLMFNKKLDKFEKMMDTNDTKHYKVNRYKSVGLSNA